MKQQQNFKTCIYLNGKKKVKSSEIDNEKVYAVSKLNEISFIAVTDLKSKHGFHRSKFNLILSILLLYTYSVYAGKTFGEMLGDLGSFDLGFDEEIDESNLPDYGTNEELIAAAEEDCKKLDEFCDEMENFWKYLDDFMEKF
ncbi:hypothetical protein NBO_7g0062 [Nosema bombycis CQ1]|uniref:Uncharacterized protein n=1 Tax=Nosema bombycis (strain CQ1 / CVCC 102059) TaxID=578461 RepID=R0KWG7_NOSB1|nr:hypothetical protein NBO_7g0062 [Nosema bombycis CQ1]|eukprot:EOB15241.1 hypothetical protein NBO_7g0062 [Nosema bombycis CQ1]